ncbi:MAG TPA: limonene-1,2-epoxide hydrolase family protein [Ilumatobacteraceae bacterium]|jgi:limonene-1,2-epoxide hydrolase
MTGEHTPEQIVDEFIRRVVGADLDGAAELVSDDLEYDNVPFGKNIGPEAFKTFLQAMVGGFASVEFVIHRQVASGNLVMNERTDRFHHANGSIDLPVAGLFEINADGKIALWRDYFDMATFTNQMAAMAAPSA